MNCQVAILLIITIFASSAVGQTPASVGADTFDSTAQNRAIERGLKFLTARQQENGSFGDGYYQGDAAITAFAGMAFISSGDVCEKKDSPAAKCAQYLLSITRPDGFINRPADAVNDGSFRPMYGHGFAVLYLSEIAGMYPQEDLYPKLDKSIKLILASQNDEGGWRYFPRKNDADVSVTACQVMALRAARNAGRDVPAQTIEKAVSYLKSCKNSDGGFMYMRPSGESALPRTAAVVTALLSAGQYNDPVLKPAFEYLDKQSADHFTDNKSGRSALASGDYPFYSLYYLTGADRQGQINWTRNHRKAVSLLIESQNPDGSWSSEFSKDYATAIALIVLQIENNYLPIWQK